MIQNAQTLTYREPLNRRADVKILVGRKVDKFAAALQAANQVQVLKQWVGAATADRLVNAALNEDARGEGCHIRSDPVDALICPFSHPEFSLRQDSGFRRGAGAPKAMNE